MTGRFSLLSLQRKPRIPLSSDTYRGSNAEPDDVPDCFGDKEETVAFDAIEDFFIFVIHLNFPSMLGFVKLFL